MRLTRFVSLCGLALAALAVLATPAAAQPSSAPAAAADFDPSKPDSVKAWLAKWSDQMRQASTEAGILALRAELINGYRYADEYRRVDLKGEAYTFAQQAAAIAAPLLDSPADTADPNRILREVNLAIALAQMPQVPIEPALSKMVHHRNAGVRYQGWAGYAAARMRILAQGDPWAQNLLKDIRSCADREESALVLGAMFRVMEMDPTRPEAVREEIWDKARKQIMAAIQDNWQKWCRRMRSCDADMIDSGLRMVSVLSKQAATLPKDSKDLRPLLQMLVDLAWCAGKSYEESKGLGRTGDMSLMVMRDVEKTLKELTPITKSYIEKVLADAKITEPGFVLSYLTPAGDQLGVLGWAEALRDRGVVEPKYERLPKPSAASAPAK